MHPMSRDQWSPPARLGGMRTLLGGVLPQTWGMAAGDAGWRTTAGRPGMELSGPDLKELVVAIPGRGAACLTGIMSNPLILGFARWWPLVCRTWALILGFILGLTRSAA